MSVGPKRLTLGNVKRAPNGTRDDFKIRFTATPVNETCSSSTIAPMQIERRGDAVNGPQAARNARAEPSQHAKSVEPRRALANSKLGLR